MIPGVIVKDLKTIPDERGRLMVILRNDEPCFTQFGQAYITTTYPGVVKGWHSHRIQTDYVCCLEGMIKLVLHQVVHGEKRQGSLIVSDIGPVQELFIGTHNPKLVVIPPGILHGWKCISEKEAIILCIPSDPYDNLNPDEQRIDPHVNHIPYQWERRDG